MKKFLIYLLIIVHFITSRSFGSIIFDIAYKLKDISGQSKGKINQFDKISLGGMNYKDITL